MKRLGGSSEMKMIMSNSSFLITVTIKDHILRFFLINSCSREFLDKQTVLYMYTRFLFIGLHATTFLIAPRGVALVQLASGNSGKNHRPLASFTISDKPI